MKKFKQFIVEISLSPENNEYLKKFYKICDVIRNSPHDYNHRGLYDIVSSRNKFDGSDIIGVGTHHRILFNYGNPNNHEHAAKSISNHLTNNNIKHEIDRDEWNRLTIYIPQEQEEK